MSNVFDSFTAWISNGNVQTVIAIALIIGVVIFCVRGVSRLFEAVVMSVIASYMVYQLLNYFNIQIDYAELIHQVSVCGNQLVDFVRNLPK